jgi:acyl-CoA thioester hydrolase
MLQNETRIRVRYGETDRMGYLHHGTYPMYFEVGRTELLRHLGLSYKAMEDDGILLPVREIKVRYLLPALYDDELIVKTFIRKKPSVKIEFEYEVYNLKDELLCKAESCLVFVDSFTRKPIRMPEYFWDLVKSYF